MYHLHTLRCSTTNTVFGKYINCMKKQKQDIGMSKQKAIPNTKPRAASVSQPPAGGEMTKEEKDNTLLSALELGKKGLDEANAGIAFRTGAKPTQSATEPDARVDSNVLLFKMFEKEFLKNCLFITSSD